MVVLEQRACDVYCTAAEKGQWGRKGQNCKTTCEMGRRGGVDVVDVFNILVLKKVEKKWLELYHN